MKHILFSLPYGLGFRNIVCGDILSGFVARGGRATVLLPPLPPVDRSAVAAELPPDVGVRELRMVRPTLPFTYLKALKQYQYSRRTALGTFQIKYQRRRQQRPAFHYAVTAAERAGEWLMPERVVDALLRTWRQPFEDYYRRMLSELRPSAVAVTKPGYMPEELPLLKVARSLGIPSIAIDTTWDNMASKRPPYILPDFLTVWNGWMHGEAIDYYRFPRSAVEITGGTQFDVLFRTDRWPSRSDALSALGLDPARKLIVFSLNAPMYAPDNPGYIRLLLENIRSGAIRGTPNLVVRMHPFDRDSRYDEAVAGYSNVVLQRGFALGSRGSAYECLPTHDDVRRYGALMGHADLLLNQASTTSLDAMATDTPVVNIAFDLKPTHPDMSIARIYGFTHYKRIVDSGAVRLAHDEQELNGLINAYLGDPTLDAANREQARQRFVSTVDGRAAERIANVLWEQSS